MCACSVPGRCFDRGSRIPSPPPSTHQFPREKVVGGNIRREGRREGRTERGRERGRVRESNRERESEEEIFARLHAYFCRSNDIEDQKAA